MGGQGGQFGEQGGNAGWPTQFGGQSNQGGPNQGGQTGNQQAGNQQSSTAAPTTTTQTPRVRQCIARCITTMEYNPICGSNRIQYQNRSALTCARTCGVGKLIYDLKNMYLYSYTTEDQNIHKAGTFVPSTISKGVYLFHIAKKLGSYYTTIINK